ncbi:16730_t:CDS:2, partial [Racocetra persica]
PVIIYDAIQFVAKAWENVTEDIIIHAWQKTEILPSADFESSIEPNDNEEVELEELIMQYQNLKNPENSKLTTRLNPTWLLYIQETAYGLFCTFYPDYNQDIFIDEWLNYSNHEGLFSASSIKNPSFTRFSLRYWCTILNVAPNLSNIHTEHRNRLSPIQAAKMAQVSCSDDYIDGNNDVDEFIVNLNQISEKLIDKIHVLDLNSEETIPALMDIFDSKIVERSLN